MADGDYYMSSPMSYDDRVPPSEEQGNTMMTEEELASKTLHIQSKRFYLDVKQNRRGRFLKIAEVSSGGRKNRILMSMNVASELRHHLQAFDALLSASEGQTIDNDDQHRSAVISRDDRKYYLDLKENERGKFLRISMVGMNTTRTQIAIPEQGIQDLGKLLASLIEEFGTDDDHDSIESLPVIEPTTLPESKYLRADNKHFYFDCGSNNRGVYMRISEVRPNFRTAITVPEKAWTYFRDNINDCIQLMNNERNNPTSTVDNSQLPIGENLPTSTNGVNEENH